jgi:hypothetical protein
MAKSSTMSIGANSRPGSSILAAGFAHIAWNPCRKYLFPITDGKLVVQFIHAVILILADRMWEKKSQPKSVVIRRIAG